KITLQNKKKALQKPQKSEIEQISDLMGEFKKQLESRNVAKIEKISQFIPGREKFVDQLTANYKKLSVKITNFQYIAQKQHATADIELTNLVDKNGQLVKPASWSKFSIKIAKDSRKQYKIHW
ncbi:MAG: hypothetical protein OQL06_08345, partial [Gammaproteobacteria bacterium]|nr:hypothetical protein [Gammaproteobacteria bacterium]